MVCDWHALQLATLRTTLSRISTEATNKRAQVESLKQQVAQRQGKAERLQQGEAYRC
jgi:hypothetical protein